MDTFLADPAENLDFQAALQAENAQLEADDLNEQLIAQQAGLQPPPIVLFKVEDGLEKMEQSEKEGASRPIPAKRSLVHFDDHCPSRPDGTTKRKTDGASDTSEDLSTKPHI